MIKKFLAFLFLFLIGGNSMVSGGPDFDAKLQNDRSISVVDPGENAERINGVGGSLYRSGHWIWADGFESGSIAAHYRSGGGTQALDNTFAWNGVNAAKLTTGNVNGNLSDLSKDFPLYPTRMGLEVMFNPLTQINQTILFRIVWNRSQELAANSLTGAVQLVYDGSGNVILQLLEDVAGTPTFTTEVSPLYIKNTQVPTIFHSLKFICDFNAGTYGTLYLDYLKFDFSNKLLGKTAQANPLQGQWVTMLGRITTNEAAPKNMNLDDIIFTADEP